MGKYRQQIRLNKNLHFKNFLNGFDQWQLQLPPKFVVGQKNQNELQPKFSWTNGCYRLLSISKLDLYPLKWHVGAERGANIKSVQKNTISEIWHHKQRSIETCERPKMWTRPLKTKSKSPKYQHASVKALLTPKTKILQELWMSNIWQLKLPMAFNGLIW